MTPAQLSRTIRHTLPRVLSDDGGAEERLAGVRVVVESPPRRGGGDYATGVAFQAAAACGRPAQEVAEELCARLVRDEDVVAEAIVVAGGFVNVTLGPAGRTALVRTLAESGSGAESGSSEGSGPTDGSDSTVLPGLLADESGTTVLPGPPTDIPAQDIPRWAASTGEDPAALAVRTERSSSLFRVQYAHARVCSLLRNGRRLGLRPEPESAVPLCAAGARLLALLADRARITEPGALARHLDAVAGAFAVFHDACPPLPRGEEKPGAAHRGRLALAEATGAVLAGGLSQLGVTAPAQL
ncbi:DALR anticodon-binding domain-containing protein [Streptomyces sp. 8N114]|uniref:DALR anticodon-binding domain-containing protein n=1 Tax=Streptomyces sp. 8N114 TaxID=3457419 RepID=UPI003FD1158C